MTGDPADSAIFQSIDFVDGVDGEVNRRLAVPSLLYNKRRTNGANPRISLAELGWRRATDVRKGCLFGMTPQECSSLPGFHTAAAGRKLECWTQGSVHAARGFSTDLWKKLWKPALDPAQIQRS